MAWKRSGVRFPLAPPPVTRALPSNHESPAAAVSARTAPVQHAAIETVKSRHEIASTKPRSRTHILSPRDRRPRQGWGDQAGPKRKPTKRVLASSVSIRAERSADPAPPHLLGRDRPHGHHSPGTTSDRCGSPRIVTTHRRAAPAHRRRVRSSRRARSRRHDRETWTRVSPSADVRYLQNREALGRAGGPQTSGPETHTAHTSTRGASIPPWLIHWDSGVNTGLAPESRPV